MEEGAVTKVLNDFLTVSEGEISLKKGDIVQVLKKVDRHWWYGCCCGKYGNIPSSYLLSLDLPPIEDSHELFAAVADFPRQQDGDLSFRKGELIVGISQVNENWWYGRIGTRAGMFPVNYVWQLDSKLLKGKSKQQVMNLKARVKMNMKAQLEEEIDLHVGDIVTVTEIMDKDWCRGVCGTRTGIFPSAYIEILHDNDELKGSKTSYGSNLNLPVQLPVSSHNATRLESKDDIDSLLALSPEAQFPPAAKNSVTHDICAARTGIFPSTYVEILHDNDELRGSKVSYGSDLNLPVQLPVSSISATRLESKDDIDSLLALSPEAQFPPAAKNSVTHNINDSNVFDDDYFRVNMPSLYRSESEIMADKTDTYNNQPLLELDVVPYGITLYPFFAQFENELSFHEGEIVTLCRHIDIDWIEGKIDGKKGIFPKSYVNILVDCKDFSSAVGDTSRNYSNELQQFPHHYTDTETELTPNVFAKVLYKFDAQMNGDLSVHKDEVVWVVNKANEDWCEVRNQSGEVGLCPQNYLTPHLLQNESSKTLLRGSSLATDNLLCLFSSATENTNNNFVDMQHLSSGGSKRKYQSHDFMQSGSVSMQQERNIGDLISKNVETFNVTAQTVKFLPSHRHSVNLSESRNAAFMSGGSNKGVLGRGLSVSPKMREEESAGSVDRAKPNSEPYSSPSQYAEDAITSSEPVQTHHPSLHQYTEDTEVNSEHLRIYDSVPSQSTEDPKNKVLVEQSNEETSWGEGEVELRRHDRTPSHVSRSRFRRQDLSRRSSDRLPHRPAPPVPVPGQQPVRRSLRRAPKQGTELPGPIVAEENVASEGQHLVTDNNRDVLEERRRKNAEHRQNVIAELVLTEKEYVRDLKVTYETFNLYNPRPLEDRGIDVKVVFGNILEVMQLAESLLDNMQLAMKGKDEDEQCMGPCFVEVADQMKCVYGYYCMNHNGALTLLEKYESVEEIQSLFNKGLETLRYQIACFDMSSILIKPVQRILRYPLILNELIKCTEDSHKDKPELLIAVKTMLEVATYINEYKRRKDIVSKYLVDGNTTISGRMSKISLHSVAKKSSRLGAMLTSTLFGVATKDPVFDEQESIFHAVEKTVRTFLKDVAVFMSGMNETMPCELSIGMSVDNFYQDYNSEAKEYHHVQQLISRKFLVEFKKIVEQRVWGPLNTLIELFEGPAILVQKRHDKLLDYDGFYTKAEKNKDSRAIQEDLLAAKSNYEALNSHLLDELPTLNSLACEVLVECLEAFVMARKMLSGKITREYLALMETPFMKSSQGDAVESFAVRHSLVWNQLVRFSFFQKGGKTDTFTKRNIKSSPTPPARQMGSDAVNRNSRSQSSSQQAFVQSRYSHDMLYCVVQSRVATEPMELTVERGSIVGVIKKHNPVGDTRMWFVDDGLSKGFLPKSCLEPLHQHVHSASPTGVPSRSSNDVPSRSNDVPSRSSNDVPSPEEFKRSGQRKSESWTYSSTSRLQAPPPSYEDVVSSAESSPRLGRSRPSAASDHEYHSIDECETDGHANEETPESEVSTVYENVPSSGDGNAAGFFYAAYDFTSAGTNMLGIKTGQIVLVLQQHDVQGNPEWWFVEDRFGGKGYVPGNYLRRYEQ